MAHPLEAAVVVVNRAYAVEPPGATRWLIRHVVPGGYVSWWQLGQRGDNLLLAFYKHYAYADVCPYTHECRKLLLQAISLIFLSYSSEIAFKRAVK